MRLPNIAFYAFRQENGEVLTINCILGCTSKNVCHCQAKYIEKGASRAAVGKTIRKAATDAFNRKLQTLQKKMKCFEDTFPSSCYCKTFEFCIDLLKVDEKYPIP